MPERLFQALLLLLLPSRAKAGGATQFAAAGEKSTSHEGPLATPYHDADAARLNSLLRAAVAPKSPLFQLAARVLPAAEVDIVISGGALRGYFMLGARQALDSRADLSIKRFSGTSAGAWSAMFMATGIQDKDWLRTYTLTQAVAQRAKDQGQSQPALMEAYRESLWPWLQTVLPADAYKRCSGRLFVTISRLTPSGPQPLVVSQFESNQELFEACVASASLPMVTQKGFGSEFQGQRGFDGLFTSNIPLFKDHARPMLIFDLGKVPYPLTSLVTPNDPCIEALVVSGAIQTLRFLEGRRGLPNAEVCAWQGWQGRPPYPNHRVGPKAYLAALWEQRPRPPDLRAHLELPRWAHQAWPPQKLHQSIQQRLPWRSRQPEAGDTDRLLTGSGTTMTVDGGGGGFPGREEPGWDGGSQGDLQASPGSPSSDKQ